MQIKDMVHLRDLRLPEFDKNRRIDEQKALIFDGKCRYDVILGADFQPNQELISIIVPEPCIGLKMSVP